MSKFIVTITPPTPNGDLHIGHLAGPFLSADVFVRAQRQRGHECRFVSYSDDYQSYMVRKGLETGREPHALGQENTEKIKATLQATKVDIDNWMSAWENQYFLDAANEIYAAAKSAGVLVRRASSEPYCRECNRWGYEAFGRGNCNYCGHDSDASQCEHCAFPPDANKMENFRCKICATPSEWRLVEREYLDVKAHHNYLKKIYAAARLREPMDKWTKDILDRGPALWPITRPEEAGLDLLQDGSRRLHTWVLGLSGYMASCKEFACHQSKTVEDYEAFWHSSGTQLVHFLGYDCAYSHMVIYPILLAYLPDPKPVPRFFANQFLKLDGENLSTSRNHAIWAKDLVSQYDPDAVRLFLASIAPEKTEGDFRLADFQQWYASTYLQVIPRILALAEQERAAESNNDCEEMLQAFSARWQKATNADSFSLQGLAHLVLDIIAVADVRAQNGRPLASLVRVLGDYGRPILPGLSQEVSARLAAEIGKPVPDYII